MKIKVNWSQKLGDSKLEFDLRIDRAAKMILVAEILLLVSTPVAQDLGRQLLVALQR